MRIDGIEYVTTTQAAKILGVSAGRVRQLVASGILGSRTVGKNNLVPLASVQWYAENKKEAGRPPKIKGLTP